MLEINEGLETPGRRLRVGSVEAVVNIYLASAPFAQLADGTKTGYRHALAAICEVWGDLNVADIQRSHVIALRDRYADKPASGDRLVTLLRILLTFAIEREYRSDNPAEKIKRLQRPRDVEGHTPWPDWATEKFLAERKGTMMGLAAAIGLYTGQRQGDCLRMRWSDITDGHIAVRQGKTGIELQIPIHTALQAELDLHMPISPVILTTARGIPFKGANFRRLFRVATNTSGLHVQGLSFHGLRYAAADQLAELGCSLKEIAAITGHQSLSMLAKYTKGADQRRMGGAAISLWEEHAKNAKVENRSHATGKLKTKRLKDGPF